jgi:inorganic pyrophosphatase
MVEVEVVVEVPLGSFLKRGSTGQVDFVSPLPCPFNYGSIPTCIGLDGDLFDAVVLGPRLPVGSRVQVRAWGAIALMDRGMTDHKLICSNAPLSRLQKDGVLRFFHFYAGCKALLNLWRRRPGRNACDGWCDVSYALAQARPRTSDWGAPPISF